MRLLINTAQGFGSRVGAIVISCIVSSPVWLLCLEVRAQVVFSLVFRLLSS